MIETPKAVVTWASAVNSLKNNSMKNFLHLRCVVYKCFIWSCSKCDKFCAVYCIHRLSILLMMLIMIMYQGIFWTNFTRLIYNLWQISISLLNKCIRKLLMVLYDGIKFFKMFYSKLYCNTESLLEQKRFSKQICNV